MLRSLLNSARSFLDLLGVFLVKDGNRWHKQRFGGDGGLVVCILECTEDEDGRRIGRRVDGNSTGTVNLVIALHEAGIPSWRITREWGGLGREDEARRRDRRSLVRGKRDVGLGVVHDELDLILRPQNCQIQGRYRSNEVGAHYVGHCKNFWVGWFCLCGLVGLVGKLMDFCRRERQAYIPRGRQSEHSGEEWARRWLSL
jgi:hypothetical protein